MDQDSFTTDFPSVHSGDDTLPYSTISLGGHYTPLPPTPYYEFLLACVVGESNTLVRVNKYTGQAWIMTPQKVWKLVEEDHERV